jgi:hypothetical protein
LSIIGEEPPDWMQGRAFLGTHEDEPREYVFGFRGRMDERYDMVRSVRKDNYIYIRNYNPHLIYGQYIEYMWITRTTSIWDEMYQAGELEPPQTYFWEPKPAVEFYDLENDPYEVNNLADSEEHREIIEELQNALHEHILNTRDAGFLHEGEMHRRANEHGLTIYEMAQDERIYPLERILQYAEIAANRDMESMSHIMNGFEDDDPAIRYWAVLIELAPADKENAFVSIAALNILSELEESTLERIKPALRNIAVEDPNLPGRPNDYVPRLVSDILDEEE